MSSGVDPKNKKIDVDNLSPLERKTFYESELARLKLEKMLQPSKDERKQQGERIMLDDLLGKTITRVSAESVGKGHRLINIGFDGGCLIVSFYDEVPSAQLIDLKRGKETGIFGEFDLKKDLNS